ncbi:MAG: hypothetical protein J0H74_25995 [Chitinophagaceae bacterium]|nr:hypothetical protein [Chitinophagaceae bacterium]
MKSLLLALLSLTSFYAHSQDCAHYLFLQKNKTIEMTIYNKKGEVSAKQVYQVSDVSSGGGVTKGSLSTEMFDKNGKSMAKASSTVQCNGGVMMVSMKMMLPQQQTEQIKMEAKAETDNMFLEYPGKLSVGDALKDGNMTMEMNTSGIPSKTTIVISDRKVEGQESVTTPAGTWDCYKITYKGKMTTKMGPIPINTNLDGTEWFVPGFGIVKTESKHGSTVITSIK